MEGKKISFGFMKTKKVQKPVAEEKKEYVECMEEKSIKVVGGEEVKEMTPLVIPMKPNTLITAERLKQIAAEVESVVTEPETIVKSEPLETTDVPENETLEQMAVRELMQDAKKEIKIESKEFIVPVPSKPMMEGQKESTLDDYEDVPIKEFGMALLRGMGWTPTKEASKYKQPQLRPKGLGLGADKVISENQKTKAATNEKGEELSIIKNSYVKITSGKYSGYYGKVLSLDEENGRVMVDISVKKETVSLSEFMMQPVTKGEFDKESKVIKKVSNRPTSSQLEALVEFLEQHPGIAGGLLRTAQGKQESRRKWAKLATSLNALGGVIKDGPGWAKYWAEKKCGLKKLCAQNAASTRQTGEGSGHSTILSRLDQRLVAVMGGTSFVSGDNEVAVNPFPQTHSVAESAGTPSTSQGGVDFQITDEVSFSVLQPQESNTEALEETHTDRIAVPPQSNADSFDKYKQGEKLQKTFNPDSPKPDREASSSTKDTNHGSKSDAKSSRKDNSPERSRDRQRRDSSSSEERSRRRHKEKKKKKRYSSNDSLSSLSDSEKKRKHKSSRKRHSSSSDSDSDSPRREKRKPEKKRDIDKKRKGKKKKRDRDRSPSHKKYRK